MVGAVNAGDGVAAVGTAAGCFVLVVGDITKGAEGDAVGMITITG